MSTTTNVIEHLDGQYLLPATRDAIQPPRRPQHFRWRTCKTYIPHTTLTRVLTAIVFVQVVIYISLEAYIWCQGDFVGLAAFDVMLGPLITLVFESLYQIYLSLDAVRRRNTVQVIGICWNNLSMCILMVLTLVAGLDAMSYQRNDFTTYFTIRSASYVLVALLAMSTIALCAVAWRLYSEFEW